MGGIVAFAAEPSQPKLEAALGHKVNTKVFDALRSKHAQTPAVHETRQTGGKTHGQNGKQTERSNGVHVHRPTSQTRNSQNRQMLLQVSLDIEATLQEIREELEWQEFRDQIQEVVNQTSNVQTMICLGLGNWAPREFFQRTNCFVIQYAVFAYMYERVDKRWRDECASNGTKYRPVKRYFQDPAFDEQTKYILRDVPRPSDRPANNIIADPAASSMIRNNRNTFVFAPHLNCNIWPGMLSLQPQVFIGNSPKGLGGRDMAAMETYIQECEITNSDDAGPRLKALQTIFRATDTKYLQSDLVQGPVDPDHLANLTIYQRSK